MSFDRVAVEQFLYREARLLDARAYDEWLELYDEKATYWIPSNRDDVDPTRHVSIVYADRGQLELRIEQLLGGGAWSQDPPSRLCRAVSNIEILECGEGVLAVESVVQLVEVRRERQRLFTGRVHHRLRPHEAAFKIAEKRIHLVDNDSVIDNVTFLV